MSYKPSAFDEALARVSPDLALEVLKANADYIQSPEYQAELERMRAATEQFARNWASYVDQLIFDVLRGEL